MRAFGLAVPARDARKTVRDVLDLDVERRGIEEIQSAAGKHALPGAGRCRTSGSHLLLTHELRVPVAGDEVVVHHADGLHEGVNDRRPTEFEAALFQLFGYFLRKRCFDRNLALGAEAIDARLTVHKIPQKGGEARTLFHHLEPSARRQNGAVDFHLVSHDAGVFHQRSDFLFVVAGNFCGLKIGECFAKIVTLPQNRDPRKTGLESIEHKLLVKRAVVVFGYAPLRVVIGHVNGIVAAPEAATKSVVMQKCAHDFAASPGNGNFAQSGLTSVIGMLPALSYSFAANPSSTRSRRIFASPRPPAVEPKNPAIFSPI